MKILISTTIALLLALTSYSQSNKTNTFDYKDFDKVYLQGLNANTHISVGKTWSVRIEGPEITLNSLEVIYTAAEHKLEIRTKPVKLPYQKNLKKTNIYISMPEVSVVSGSGNGDVNVKGIIDRYFRLEQEGNGDYSLSGTTNDFDLEKGGNGDLNATSLLAKNLKFTVSGNGDTKVNCSEKMTGKLSGNGDLINRGAARCTNCKKIGNGSISY